jgi:uncharacterized membrane protein YkvA (DUF1232 family)
VTRGGAEARPARNLDTHRRFEWLTLKIFDAHRLDLEVAMDPFQHRRLDHWRQFVHRLKLDVAALYLAYRDPRVPWPAKLFTALVVGYALSPIDLIPDMIPVLGYLDDLVVVPLGLYLALRMIPPQVLAECRHKAADRASLPRSRAAAVIIMGVWLAALAAAGWWGWQRYSSA